MELKLPDLLRFPFDFDTLKMKQELEALEKEYWVEHFVKQNYSGQWAVLPLTAQKGRDHPILMASAIPGDYEFVPTPFLDKCPYFQEVLGTFQTQLRSVRLMRLGAGSEIKEHSDTDLDENEIRIHIPVLTNPEVFFYLKGKLVKLSPGECWYMKLSNPHRVSNQSDEDRVHLVIDMELNDWVWGVFKDNEGLIL